MKVAISAVAAGLALAMALPAQADQGDWLARGRLLQIRPSVSSTTGTLGVSNEVVPELDFTYFLTNNIAAELILGTSRHTVTASGAITRISLAVPL